jgi:hypothetical protein
MLAQDPRQREINIRKSATRRGKQRTEVLAIVLMKESQSEENHLVVLLLIIKD